MKIVDSFEKIPCNVYKWFLSGGNVDFDEKKKFLPLGICDDGPGKIDILKYYESTNHNKLYKYYVNWSNHTLERYKYKERWRNNLTGKFLVEESVSLTHFQKSLSESEYTICTFGFGLDCYRNYEALCCNSIPILLNCKWSKGFEDELGGCVLVNSWLELEDKNFNKRPLREFNKEKLTVKYWKDKIYGEVDNV